MILTNENYFSVENQLKYMGASQFKSFMACEAMALAEIRGDWQREETTALLVGSYVDAHFEGTLDIFRAKNPEIFTKQGTLKSDYKQADYIIERIERDEMFMRYMSGVKQVIKTGNICGVPFKIKIDSYHPNKAIVDLKIMKDFERIWDSEAKKYIPFVEKWGYDYQAAIYQAIEGNDLPFFIAGATKEKEPNIALISIPQERIDLCMAVIESLVTRYQSIKKSEIDPRRCDQCDYCKSTKVLEKIIDYTEV